MPFTKCFRRRPSSFGVAAVALGPQGVVEAHLRGIRDKKGRLIVVMTHNTDTADGWEREGEGDQFFFQFSPESYALGIIIIMIIIYALTH